MFSSELLAANLLSPVVLAFALGMLARLLRSDLEIPAAIQSYLSIFLLLAIGLKGGVALGNNAPDKTIDVDGLPGPDIFFYPSLWNAPVSKAIARGVELESSWLPTDRLRVDFNLGLLQTEYQELGLAGTGAVPAVSLGSQFAGAPEETANLAVSYDIPLASGAMLLPRMDYTYTAEYTLQTGEILQRTQDAFGMLNARLTYDSGQEWTVELSVTNLTNEYYFNSGFFTRAEQIHFMTVGRPREWGLTFNYNY